MHADQSRNGLASMSCAAQWSKNGTVCLEKRLGLLETLGEQHDFCNEFLVWLGHCNAAEQFLQVVGQV